MMQFQSLGNLFLPDVIFSLSSSPIRNLSVNWFGTFFVFLKKRQILKTKQLQLIVAAADEQSYMDALIEL